MRASLVHWGVLGAITTATTATAARAQSVDPAPAAPPAVVEGASAPIASAPIGAPAGVEIVLPQRTAIDPAMVQREAARQLSEAQARGSLSIYVSPDNQLTVRWRDEQGRELARTVPAPNDPFEFVRTVGVLVANLANDQLRSLLPPQVVLAPPPVVIQLQQSSATPPMPAQPVVAPTQPPAQPPAVAPDWRALRARQRVSFGFDSYLTYEHRSFASPTRSFSNTTIGSIGGVFVNAHVNAWLRVGAQQIFGGPMPTASGFYVSAAPYAEALASPWRWLELYGQLGVGLQYQRSGASGFAAAPSLTAGARFRLGEVFSIAIGARGAYSARGTFMQGASAITEGQFVAGGGTELAWTVGG